MKNLLIIPAVIVMLFSCKKKDSTPASTTSTTTPPVTTASTYYIEANINNALVRADKIISVQSDSGYNSFDAWTTTLGMLKYVNTSTAQNWSINLSYNLDSIVVPRTFNDNDGNMQIMYFPPGAATAYSNDQYEPTTTLTMTSKTNDILEGVFSGKLYSTGTPRDSMIITNGKFKVRIYRL